MGDCIEGKEHMFEPGTKWVDEDGDLRATCKYCQQDITRAWDFPTWKCVDTGW